MPRQRCLVSSSVSMPAAEQATAVLCPPQVRDSAAPEVVDFSAIYKLVYGGKPAGQ
jgi:hypothetical protein